MTTAIEYLKPEGMHHNPAFSQGIILPANARTLLVGGQNAVDANGEIVGKGDIAKQTEKALSNMQLVLDAAGARIEDIVKMTIVIREDADLRAGFGAWMAVWGQRTNPPAVTAMRVAALAHPDFLIEIDAMAVLK